MYSSRRSEHPEGDVLWEHKGGSASTVSPSGQHCAVLCAVETGQLWGISGPLPAGLNRVIAHSSRIIKMFKDTVKAIRRKRRLPAFSPLIRP